MNLIINGQEQNVENIHSIVDLIQHMQLENKRIAVELNGTIVPKSAHALTFLSDGDALEIVVAVGGG